MRNVKNKVEVGEVISHKYEVLALLDEDNLGEVYKARHVVLDTILALKVLPREIIANPDAAARFYRQARSLVRIRHPHLVQMFDLEQDETLGFYYVVMDIPEQTPQYRTCKNCCRTWMRLRCSLKSGRRIVR
jgi:serine/threonine protein kinase